MGFELVLARVLGNARRTLQVMAEPHDRTRHMTVEDCAGISHALSAVLDVADPLRGASYDLEVSTPGIDRPLVRLADYERFAGFEAKVETDVPVGADNRRRFTGVVRGLAGDEVLVESGGETLRIPFVTIKKARLVLTDALLKSHAAAAERHAAAKAAAAAGAAEPAREVG
jgi:ribosome maturation factor RimP